MEKSIGINFIVTRVISMGIIGLASPLLAMAYHSWFIFFIGIGIMMYLNREEFGDNINYNTDLEGLYKESFKNYI